MSEEGGYSSAIQDFKRARSRAALQQLFERLGIGSNQELLRFEQVRKMLGGSSQFPRGLQVVPLNVIVGSVGRYEDFTRQFFPRKESQRSRWARVRMTFDSKGFPPVELYKIGDIYFVQDGHHRVSVARQLGAESIEAYVTEIPTKVKAKLGDNIEDLILKAEVAKFIEDTRLDQLRHDVDLRVTLPGGVRELREHIAVHRYYMGIEQKREISFEQAASHWVDEVYVPALQAIRQLGLLQDFPSRTEADLYLWLMKNRSELEHQLGWSLGVEESAAYLWNRLYAAPRRSLERFRRWLARVTNIESLDIGPVPTEWRLDRGELHESATLFPRILVPASGEDESWSALEVAIQVARHEGSELRGVHVLGKDEKENSPKTKALKEEFERRIAAADLSGGLVFEKGNIHRQVENRSHWSDLVVLHLKHPPGAGPLERLLSGLRMFLQRSPRPVLVVPEKSELRHGLLAYDGSRKAAQALYLATYLARHWGVKITVFTALEHGLRETFTQSRAKDYLTNHGVHADYLQRRGLAGPGLLAAAERGCDFILMGGYDQSALMEIVRGSTLDTMLREFRGPVWVCN